MRILSVRLTKLQLGVSGSSKLYVYMCGSQTYHLDTIIIHAESLCFLCV